MTKGICEREDKKADVTYFIRYQLDGTDIKGRLGKKSRGFTREMAKEALKSRLGFDSEVGTKPKHFWCEEDGNVLHYHRRHVSLMRRKIV